MDLYDYLGIAIKRKNGKLLIITPDGTFRKFVEELVLNSHDIYLGDVLNFNILNNGISNYRKVNEPYDESTKIVVVGDSVVFENIPGILQKIQNTEDYYFTVLKFKYVVFFGNFEEISNGGLNEIGSCCRLRMRLMEEDEKLGSFTTLTWCATLYEPPVVPIISTESTEPTVEMHGSKIGIVTAELSNERRIWTRHSYPGQNIAILTNDVNIAKVGTWVKFNLSKQEIEQYFPATPSPSTPKLEIKNFEAIDPVFPTKVHGTSVSVTIPNVEIKENKKNDIDHPFFGVLNDQMNKVTSASGYYDISIIHGPTKKTKNGNLTVWSFYEITQNPVNPTERKSRIDQPKNRWSLARSKSKPKMKNTDGTWTTEDPQQLLPTAPPIKKKTKSKSRSRSKGKKGGPMHQWTENPAQQNQKPAVGQNVVQPVVQQQTTGPSQPVVKTIQPIQQNQNANVNKNVIQPVNQQQTHFPYKPFAKNYKSKSPKGKPQPQNQWFGPHQTQNKFQKTLVGHKNSKKAALITGVVQNEANISGTTCHLWLIDEHKKSVYHTTKVFSELKPGLFFDGYFVMQNGNFECINHLAPIQYPTIFIKTWKMDQIEVFVRINNHGELSTSHPLFGKIEDPKNLLPYDCSRGVRIGIFLLKKENSYVWVIDRLISVENELIEEFREAWAIEHLVKNLYADDVENLDKLKTFYQKNR